MRRLLVVLCFVAFASRAGAEQPDGSGTGFLINDQGWFATNAHVIEGCGRIEISGHGRVREQHVDRQNDLAIIRIDPAPTLRPVPIRASPPRLGEDIATLGYPLSGLLSSSVKITTGNVNSLVGVADDTRHLQISTPIQPGNSGGPVVDRSGSLVAVTVAQLGSTFSQTTGIIPQNVNFAIRGSLLSTFLQARGIAFVEAPVGTAGALSTADLADQVSPSVVPVLCFDHADQRVVTARPPSAPAQAPVLSHRYRERDGYDVVGFDYSTLRDVSYQQCIRACDRENRCMAITYNEPARFCFLKDNAAVLIRNRDAKGAYFAALEDDVLITNFTVRSNRDSPGGDYRHIRNSSFVGCFVDCAIEGRCRAFAFVRANRSCWLKERVGRISNMSGVDLGVK